MRASSPRLPRWAARIRIKVYADYRWGPNGETRPTFTIDELHVDLEAPLGGTREITFDAQAGAYRFYCRVPAHAAAGMRGTLTVR